MKRRDFFKLLGALPFLGFLKKPKSLKVADVRNVAAGITCSSTWTANDNRHTWVISTWDAERGVCEIKQIPAREFYRVYNKAIDDVLIESLGHG